MGDGEGEGEAEEEEKVWYRDESVTSRRARESSTSAASCNGVHPAWSEIFTSGGLKQEEEEGNIKKIVTQ